MSDFIVDHLSKKSPTDLHESIGTIGQAWMALSTDQRHKMDLKEFIRENAEGLSVEEQRIVFERLEMMDRLSSAFSRKKSK